MLVVHIVIGKDFRLLGVQGRVDFGRVRRRFRVEEMVYLVSEGIKDSEKSIWRLNAKIVFFFQNLRKKQVCLLFGRKNYFSRHLNLTPTNFLIIWTKNHGFHQMNAKNVVPAVFIRELCHGFFQVPQISINCFVAVWNTKSQSPLIFSCEIPFFFRPSYWRITFLTFYDELKRLVFVIEKNRFRV